LAAVLVLTWLAFAQQDVSKSEESTTEQAKSIDKSKPSASSAQAQSGGMIGASPMTWNTNLLIKLTAQNVARRYRLDPEQKNVASDMLFDKTKAFLASYETEVRDLLTEIWDVRQSGEMPSAEWAQQWSVKAKPIFDAAKTEILEGNDAFSEYLTDEQRVLHDQDMSRTRRTFEELDTRLVRWSEGGLDPQQDRWLIGQSVTPGRATSPKGAKDQSGVSAQSGSTGTTKSTSIKSTRNPSKSKPKARRFKAEPVPTHRFEQYLRKFLKDYDLTEAQTTSCWGLLSDYKGRAGVYESRNADEFVRISKELGKLSKSKAPESAAKKEKLEKRYQQLVRPIDKVFEDFKSRLDTVPTAAQRGAFKRKSTTKKPPAATPAKRTGK
jgi:hypothetical protein